MSLLALWFSFFQGEANDPAPFKAPSVVLHGGNNPPIVLRGQA